MKIGYALIKSEGCLYAPWNVTLNNFMAGLSVEDVGGEEALRADILDYLEELDKSPTS